MTTNEFRQRGEKVIQKAKENEDWRKQLLDNPKKMLATIGFDVSNANEKDLKDFFNENQGIFDPNLLARSAGGCIACQIGIVTVVAVLITGLIAAGIATGGAVAAAGAAVVSLIATAATALGISTAVLTGILTALATFSIGVITREICKALDAC